MELAQFAALMFFGFIATEGAVEYLFGTLFDKVEVIKPYSWGMKYISVAAGIGLAFVYNLDIPALWLGMPANVVGVIITGVVMGRGANAVHDIASKVSGWLNSKL